MAQILIIDDDKDFSQTVAEVLALEGHAATVENESAKALERVRQMHPDAIILDVMFPENPSEGFEIARKIREDFGQIPILMLTAINQRFPLGFSNKDIDPKWMPVTEFLEKPVDMDQLCRKIAGLVG
ncbi:MAG: response regulator [Planctomycetes bacterium]|nr:response regulator [Planctomycetota bacterium]